MKESEKSSLTKLTQDTIFELLDQNRGEELSRLLRQEFQARKSFHDLYVDWVNELTAFLAEKAGDDAVKDFYDLYYQKRSREMQDDKKYSLPIEELVRYRAKKFSGGGHDFNFTIEEDDEKFVFILNPCSSGGSLIEKSDEPRYRTKMAHYWSHHQEKFPLYCVHCIFIWELRSIDIIGYPRVVYHIPEKAGSPCIQYMWKKLEDIPEKYFERLGRKKPVTLK